jgi:hypothetical protein
MGSRGLLGGQLIGRIAGPEAIKFGWQRLNPECAKQFNIEARRQGVDAKEPDR